MGPDSSDLPWLVYGPGALGREISELATRLGLSVILGGRSEAATRYAAQRIRVPWRSGSVVLRPETLLTGVAGVINTAGPYSSTAVPLMDACLRAGVHYVDLANDAATHVAAWDRSEEAASQGMAIVCGAGVGTWLTERLVAQVASLCESPSSVTVYRTPSNGNVKSRGVHASEREILASRPIVVRAGERTALTFAHRVVATPAPRHGKSAVVIGSGEVIALQQATGLSEITSAAVVPNSALTVTVGLALRIAQARTSAAAQRLTWTNARFDPERQSQADGPRQRQPSRVLVQVMGSHEQVASGELTYVSGTTISSHSAIAVRQAIVDQTLIGTHTAYQVLGDRCLDHAPEPAIRLHAGSLRELSVR